MKKRKSRMFSTVKWKKLPRRRWRRMPQQMIMCLLGEDDLKIMMQLINNIHETGEWPKDFIVVTITALKNTPEVPNAATIARSDSLHIQQRWCRGYPEYDQNELCKQTRSCVLASLTDRKHLHV
jgi:hypothetical protein